VEIHRLNRIDNDEIGRIARIERLDDVAHAARRGETDRAVGDTESLGAQTDLVDRLLAGDVGGGAAAPRKGGGGLQQQCRFADAGIAADKDGRTRDKAPAAHPVELGDAGQATRLPGALAAQRDKIERGSAAAPGGPPAQALWRGAARHLFDEAVPGAGGPAAAPPFPPRRAAPLA